MSKLASFIVFCISLLISMSTQAANAPTEVINTLKADKSVDLIVEYDDSAIERTSRAMRKKFKNEIEDSTILNYKREQYQLLKTRADEASSHADIIDIENYSHLPMSHKRVKSLAGLNHLLAQPGVKAVYAEVKLHRVLAQSLPLINQPTVASAGEQGNSTTVAVIDDGIDYTNSAFGACTAPNTPSTNCRVVVSRNFSSTPNTADVSHGTNVSAIVLGVAPQSKVAMLNVFDTSDSASSTYVLSAINWAISNKSNYNIVAINMSLGDSSNNTSTCPSNANNNNSWASSTITNAKNAGISVVVASGNSGFTNGLASPACAPDAISVGAVYDSNVGGVTYPSVSCTDSSTSADQVACFSNSATYLSLLAPGVFITAAGITEQGTSQASPHVAGAVAVLRSVFPSETLAQTLSRMTTTGVTITDTRNNISKPRLNLLAAARPANDAFANRLTMTGSSGATTGLSILSTKETGEPNHAGNTGGQSVWWTWVAPATGQLSLDTHGSNFDTLLGVYTGTTVNGLSGVTSNDNDGSSINNSGLLLQAVANKTYQIAVDGANSSAGSIALNWSLNTTAQANLSITLTGPSAISLGSTSTYSMTIKNTGPQAATNIIAIASLPSGASYVSGNSACSASGSTITCKLASLPNGSMSAFDFQVKWNSLTGSSTIASSVTSDLPDNSSTDNSGSLVIAVDTSSGNGDVPLPMWAILLMAGCLMGILYHHKIIPSRTSIIHA